MDDTPSCMIVASNPNPDSLTVHAATCAHHTLLQQEITTELVHLDKCAFNPILTHEDIQRKSSFDEQVIYFQTLIRSHNVLGLFFPDWWGYPPALLIGWIQRVFMPGFAFAYTGNEFTTKEKKGLLSHLKICIMVSSDEDNEDMIISNIDTLSRYLFYPAGITQVNYSILSDTRNATTHKKNAWLAHNTQVLIESCKS